MRPKSIERFEKVYLVSLAISLWLIASISWNDMVGKFETWFPGGGAALAAGAFAISMAISLLLMWFVARRASNIAKWVIVVLTAIGMVGFLSSLFMATVPKDLSFAGSAATNLLSVYAAWLLFRPDAAAWLDSKGADVPGNPTIFD